MIVSVIHGGQNSEHEVSLQSGRSVITGLRDGGIDARAMVIDRNGVWSYEGLRLGRTPAVSMARALELTEEHVWFPVLHGRLGEDGTLAAVGGLRGGPLVGCGLRAGAVAMDKWMCKLLAQSLGIGIAAGTLVANSRDIPSWVHPVVVKPVSAGSSFGVSLVGVERDYSTAIDQAFAFDTEILIEEVVVGREIDIAVLRRADGSLLVGPALEICGDGIFDTSLKYDSNPGFRFAEDLSVSQLSELERISTTLFRALDCAGVCRFDYFLTETGEWILNEVNTMPGMTEHSQVPLMFERMGWSYSELLVELVSAATAVEGPDDGRCASTAERFRSATAKTGERGHG